MIYAIYLLLHIYSPYYMLASASGAEPSPEPSEIGMDDIDIQKVPARVSLVRANKQVTTIGASQAPPDERHPQYLCMGDGQER
jgi:hypothetical protein